MSMAGRGCLSDEERQGRDYVLLHGRKTYDHTVLVDLACKELSCSEM